MDKDKDRSGLSVMYGVGQGQSTGHIRYTIPPPG